MFNVKVEEGGCGSGGEKGNMKSISTLRKDEIAGCGRTKTMSPSDFQGKGDFERRGLEVLGGEIQWIIKKRLVVMEKVCKGEEFGFDSKEDEVVPRV
ncbi:hypothetical protein Tco_1102704 [Tanacetum coccineum]